MRAIAGPMSHVAGCGRFWTWALIGAAFGLGLTSLGIFTILPATLAVVFMTRQRPIRGAFGVATGIGFVLLLIAYIQRSGEFYDPIHWLIPGLVCFTVGLIGHAWQNAPR